MQNYLKRLMNNKRYRPFFEKFRKRYNESVEHSIRIYEPLIDDLSSFGDESEMLKEYRRISEELKEYKDNPEKFLEVLERALFIKRLENESKRLIADLFEKARTGNNGRKVLIIFPLRGQYFKYLFFRGIASYLRIRFGFEIKLRPLLTDAGYKNTFSLYYDLIGRLKHQLRFLTRSDWEDADIIVLDLYDQGHTIRQIELAIRRLYKEEKLNRAVKIQLYKTGDDQYLGDHGILDFLNPYRYYPEKFFLREKDGKLQPLEFVEGHKRERRALARILSNLGYLYMVRTFGPVPKK